MLEGLGIVTLIFFGLIGATTMTYVVVVGSWDIYCKLRHKVDVQPETVDMTNLTGLGKAWQEQMTGYKGGMKDGKT